MFLDSKKSSVSGMDLPIQRRLRNSFKYRLGQVCHRPKLNRLFRYRAAKSHSSASAYKCTVNLNASTLQHKSGNPLKRQNLTNSFLSRGYMKKMEELHQLRGLYRDEKASKTLAPIIGYLPGQ
ncbi:unnamed protein product [Protopolystoma xenopodis]|uniref:Uncharacterized protein n=1 Tax=Protopolystoma xenopodis TaxID=117903 RepID=A0A448WZ97_9PLAT|nr:unnamed protein product [Protopolystoma xenopodis]